MSKNMPPWSAYAVRAAGVSRFGRQSLDSISHVTHLDAAWRIFQTKELTAGLVFDESLLRKKRILVTWLSPNDWTDGYRYGNIRFTFDFRALIRDLRCYWVETISYSPTACRFLFTDRDRDSLLTPYDLSKDDGPLRHDVSDDVFLWNGEYCLELMFEKSIPLQEAQEITFVKHHALQCCISPASCPDRGLGPAKAGPRFIARLVAEGVRAADTQLIVSASDGDRTPSTEALDAIGWLLQTLSHKVKFGGVVKNSNVKQANALARAAMHEYARDNLAAARELATLFYSKRGCVRACLRIIGNALDIDPSILEFED